MKVRNYVERWFAFTNRHFKLFSIVFSLIVICIALLPVFHESGWPMNHEYWAFFDRTTVYYLHFKQFDFFPIWSAYDGMGMGSPLPLFYHKLFYFNSALYHLFCSDMKTCIILSIATFFGVGISGLYTSNKLLGLSNWHALVLAASVVFLNYTYVDWLVRGAMAEFSAAMVVCWLFWWCTRLMLRKKFGFSIIFIFTFLYLSHSIIAFYSGFMIFFVMVFYLSVNPIKKEIMQLIKKGVVSAISIFLLLLVYIFPLLKMQKFINLEIIKSSNYSPINNFVSFEKYFYNRDYIWNLDWKSISTEINMAVLFMLFALILLVVCKTFNCKFSAIKKLTPLRGFFISLLAANLFYVFLQLPVSSVFYNHLPFVAYIQFPWRLLAFIQIINLLLISILIIKVTRHYGQKFSSSAIAIFFICMMVTYPGLYALKYDWFDKSFFHPQKRYMATFGMGEYMPKIAGVNIQEAGRVMQLFETFHDKGIETLQGKCDITQLTPPQQELMDITYHVECRENSTVAFPMNNSGFERVVAKNVSIPPAFRTPEDPRMRLVLPKGNYEMEIRLPRVSHFFFN